MRTLFSKVLEFSTECWRNCTKLEIYTAIWGEVSEQIRRDAYNKCTGSAENVYNNKQNFGTPLTWIYFEGTFIAIYKCTLKQEWTLEGLFIALNITSAHETWMNTLRDGLFIALKIYKRSLKHDWTVWETVCLSLLIVSSAHWNMNEQFEGRFDYRSFNIKVHTETWMNSLIDSLFIALFYNIIYTYRIR